MIDEKNKEEEKKDIDEKGENNSQKKLEVVEENNETDVTDDFETEELEIVKGNVKDLNISTVYDHIKSDKIPGSRKKENIVIPKSSNSDK